MPIINEMSTHLPQPISAMVTAPACAIHTHVNKKTAGVDVKSPLLALLGPTQEIPDVACVTV